MKDYQTHKKQEKQPTVNKLIHRKRNDPHVEIIREFKIAMIIMVKRIVGKVDNIHGEMEKWKL